MEVIGTQTLNFRPKYKFLLINFYPRTPSPLGGALGSPGQSPARLKMSGPSTP